MSAIRFQSNRPASKKNRRRWLRRGTRTYLVPSTEAVADEASIHAIARRAAAAAKHPIPAYPDEEMELRVVYHARSDTIDVTCTPIGPKPKGFSGRARDLHGMLETLADALQKAIMANDNQIGRIVMERDLD